MTDPLARNRLEAAASPYLRQHADNPVNWQPWDDRAMELARDRDRPIFLSIGYSACHWCHVMEDESFEDETVATLLNDHFVPIKVDREERPDVDTVYMTACQLVTGRGGWPLSAWLTPDGRPFYVGTYFPRDPTRGMPGFVDVLEGLRQSWESERDEVERRADHWTERVRDQLEQPPSTPTPTTESSGRSVPMAGEPDSGERTTSSVGHETVVDAGPTLEQVVDSIMRTVDREHGGFGTGGPKFPQPRRLDALLRSYVRTGRVGALDAATLTLDAMCDGGLYDHVGGGFHRYCVDDDWTVPHFEKMLYDSASISRTLLTGYQLTGNRRYETVLRETMEFIDRELTHPEGGLYSTLDAQSIDEHGDDSEGAFYVWTPESIETALSDDPESTLRTDLVFDRYGVTEDGNFEGTTVLNVQESISSLASTYQLDEGEVERHLEAARETLFRARSKRTRPRRDEKILAGWNGLAIDALAEASIVLRDDRYERQAVEALEFVCTNLWDEASHRLSRRYMDGSVAITGYLDDYAYLARGALTVYEATGSVDHLAFAVDLARAIVDEFWDDSAETLYFTPEAGESLLLRPQELRDQSTPSPTGVAVEVLLALDAFTDDPFGAVADSVLSTHAETIDSRPHEHVSLGLAFDTVRTGQQELTVVGEMPDRWTDVLAETYLPDRLLARRPTDDAISRWVSTLSLESVPPIWEGRTARDDEPTVYACSNRTCSPPLDDLREAIEWHDETETPF
ncbi:thioredoxin domain-containing protein [Halovivax gelatinilyticus]|uniref:thioredoxin domain-containing protein n=1 Tax=Halovivax gelatinilyticus TaxID=2961597 RepID=UPI0020CA66A2|nr:thioredoxin domain-containing protein [Halovivax gelatinilyticus]